MGCVYALIAVGYTLVYGIVGVINFAYGEIHMIGAFLAIIAVAVIGAAGHDRIESGDFRDDLSEPFWNAGLRLTPAEREILDRAARNRESPP